MAGLSRTNSDLLDEVVGLWARAYGNDVVGTIRVARGRTRTEFVRETVAGEHAHRA